MDYLKTFEIKLMQLNPEEDEFIYQVDGLVESTPEEYYEQLIPIIFRFFEKFPLSDCDAPGTLIHLIEHYYPTYKKMLLDSIKREPTYNAILMVNRILNSNLSKEDRQEYQSSLLNVKNSQTISEELRCEAKHYIEYQLKKNNWLD